MTQPTIVFDLDGTLVETAPDLISALNFVLDREGLRPIPLQSARNMIGAGARKLIERDQVQFIIGDVNSGIAQAMAQVTNEKKVLHVVSGGHTDGITGTDCKWNVFRVCNTTRMEANSVSDLLATKYGKKWHFITPDYAFGHTLQTLSVVTPGLISAMALSTHSRARL